MPSLIFASENKPGQGKSTYPLSANANVLSATPPPDAGNTLT